MSTSAQRQSQRHEPAPDRAVTSRSTDRIRSGVVEQRGLGGVDGLVIRGRRSIPLWRRALAHLPGVRPAHVIDLRSESDPREEVAMADLGVTWPRPLGEVPAHHEVGDDARLKHHRSAADGRVVNQEERQPSAVQGFSVSLTDKDLVRRRDEIIARTEAEIDQLELHGTSG